ncbi:ATP-dependent metallopeptidase FtsH/Yme1/Tma family protein [Noviherbaspirillum sedimenti]|uniref:ATP-dependent metallopeptidase FtsH/Yme1/Tma family protein n=1 Tax=Noviherbaspirillum sedimenti TaxID=2320865 RepID=A0A3A3G2V1_9BURK|nr:FtsH/Yme1/Tma family ATP-dependent metallopeptidase [Noviherbaspirillum sedimenti]RJG02797.1 ATP-dependent metallopeptidase FtsH/Yme1/Tma family protein [Noviherbaspirillum sedimenti]
MSSSISGIKRRQFWRKVLIALVSLGLIGGIAAYFTFQQSRQLTQTYSQFAGDLDAGKVGTVSIAPNRDSGKAQVTLKDGKHYTVQLPSMDVNAANNFTAKGANVEIDPRAFNLDTMLPMLVMLAVLGLFGLVASRPEPLALPFRKKQRETQVRFADVAGAEEAKKNLMEIASYLKSPDVYEEIGASFPRGVVLYGDPGTGKTLLAKALAGESGANFIATNGSEFGSMFVGVSTLKIKRLFARARAMAPCVLFIDEIDAVGGRRMSEGSAAAREMSSTLNQLLVQMDGFENNNGVIVVAATNRLDSLDPALLRSGRFDRRIQVGKPNLKEREQILKIHGRKVRVEEELNYSEIARQTIGFSGADLANVMNQAAMIAVHNGEEKVVLENVLRARNVMLMGEERRSTLSLIDQDGRRRLAIHECGHAILAMIGGTDPVTAVSIVPRGQSLGQTFMAPSKDQLLIERTDLVNRLHVLLGGRVAEELFMDSMTTGADDDLSRASEIARNLVCRHGMSDFGLLTIDEDSSPQLRYEAEKKAMQIMAHAKQNTSSILTTHQNVMEAMVVRLLEKEELDSDDVREFKAMMADDPVPLVVAA